MSNILIKAVEYPKEKVIELDQLTDLGLVCLLDQIELFRLEVREKIALKVGKDEIHNK